jgi:omega-6 fatty acid desaturase (delta-12 desaturase)
VSDALHSLWDFFLIGTIYKATTYIEPLITPEHISLPSPAAYSFSRFALWSIYGFATGLVATGLWVIAHECGHQAFSESKFINNLVGWVLHSGSVQISLCFDPHLLKGHFFLSVSEFLTIRGV